MRGDLRQALAFLTLLGGAASPTPGALAWFPVVGTLLGLALGGVWWIADRAWQPAMAAALVVVADLAVTGLLHVDGLVDTADGLLPHLAASRRLDVMAEPGVGAFGVVVAGAVLLLRWAGLVTLRPAPLLLAGLWSASRTAMATAVLVVPYARAQGLATAFLAPRPRLTAVAALIGGGWASLGLAGLWSPLAGVAAVVACFVAASAVVVLARRRVGGFTGDVLGASGVVGETAGLVVAAARW